MNEQTQASHDAEIEKILNEEVPQQNVEVEQQPVAATTEQISQPTQVADPVDQEEVEAPDLVGMEELVPTLSDKTPQQIEEENGKRVKMNGQTLTVKSWTFTKPKTYEVKNGIKVPLPPVENEAKTSKYYLGKLVIRFEEDNLIEYYPSINFFLNENGINPNVSIFRNGHSKISQMFRQAVAKMEGSIRVQEGLHNGRKTIIINPEDQARFDAYAKSISDKQALDFLIGKKVLIETDSGNYNGREWFRNDFKEIL